MPAGTDPDLTTWRLHWSATGGLAVDAEAVTGGSTATLRYDPAGLPAAVVAAHPELKGYLALRLSRTTARDAGEILRGQVAVGMYDNLGPADRRHRRPGAGRARRPLRRRGLARDLRHVVALRPPVVLPVGAHGPGGLAAGLARRGQRDRAGQRRHPRGDAPRRRRRLDRRRPRRSGGAPATCTRCAVYAPTTGKVETNLVTDPYSVALTLNSTRSVAVDLSDPGLAPAIWQTNPSPELKQDVDSTIYELHVRDFSVGDTTVPAAHRGSYLAFADDGDGTKHLKALAAAGLNTVHLLPTFDIASIEEDPAGQSRPACDLASYAPDSDQQQKCVTAAAGKDGYNWGYDPYHWMAPEGSYASSVTTADGGSRVAEFRTMVGGLHRDGLRVVLDQVFNHTPASGQARHLRARPDRARATTSGSTPPARCRPRPAARTSPPSTPWPRRSWSTRSCRGRAATRSTGSAST